MLFSSNLPQREFPNLVATDDYLYSTYSKTLHRAAYGSGEFAPAPDGTLSDSEGSWWSALGCGKYLVGLTGPSPASLTLRSVPTVSNSLREIDASRPFVEDWLACDETNVFYLVETTVYRTPLAGGTPVAILPLSTNEATADWLKKPQIAVSATHVIVGLPNRVIAIPKTGGTLSTLASHSPVAVAADGNDIYFATNDASSCSATSVYRVAATGNDLTRLGFGTSCISQMYVGPNHIFMKYGTQNIARLPR